VNLRRAQALAERQRDLVSRSGQLRGDLRRDAVVVVQPLAWADRALSAWHWLQHHPQWAVGAGLVFAVLRPRRAWRLGWRAWWAWRRWQGLAALLASRL
jgi:hypothetical protein